MADQRVRLPLLGLGHTDHVRADDTISDQQVLAVWSQADAQAPYGRQVTDKPKAQCSGVTEHLNP
jgi:hypothetical protein